MSRLYWHSEKRTAELHGSEFYYLDNLVDLVAMPFWHLSDHWSDETLLNVYELLDNPDSMTIDLANTVRAVLAQWSHEASKQAALNVSWSRTSRITSWAYDPRPKELLADTLNRTLKHGTKLSVAGQELSSSAVIKNTALVVGSPAIQLAAKIKGYGEIHAFFEEEDHAAIADIIEGALEAGVYRKGLTQKDQDGTEQWVEQGWNEVLDLLRENNTGPIVLSYSVTDSFPNVYVSGWSYQAPDTWIPENWTVTEWSDAHGEYKEEYRDAHRSDCFHRLPVDEQWSMCMSWLRENKPWLRIDPNNMTQYMFGPPVTIFDLMATDREERLNEKVGYK